VYGKKQQIDDLLADPKYQSIISKTGINYEENTGEIVFDETAANAMSASQQAIFDELKDKLEGLVGQYEEAEDALFEKEEELYDYYLGDLEAYNDMVSEIKDAMATNREKEIDALSEVNDSINEANTKLVKELQSAVDKYRQERENTRTERDIEDK
jgi:hypothetical protein